MSNETEHIKLSELCSWIQEAVKHNFEERMYVVAEIANLSLSPKGHCYLELVEKLGSRTVAQMRANVWASYYPAIVSNFHRVTQESLKKGMKVLLLVTVEYHSVYGISLTVTDIDPAFSLGEMAKNRQEIIDNLKEKKLLDKNKNFEIPLLPSQIAVISSKTAAGYGDFTDQLQNNPYRYHFDVKLFAALMQGEKAAESIIKAMDKIESGKKKFDLVILIRGGGSVLDLSGFDEETLALRITQMKLPLVTGIGHERDDSIADLVAHTKLKTPTAVAEFLLDRFAQFENRVKICEEGICDGVKNLIQNENHKMAEMSHQLVHFVRSEMEIRKEQFSTICHNLKFIPKQILYQNSTRLQQLRASMLQETRRSISTNKHSLNLCQSQLKKVVKFSLVNTTLRLDHLAKAIKLTDPKHILKRGFSISTYSGRTLRSTEGLKPGTSVVTQLFKGKFISQITKTEPEDETENNLQ